MSEKESLLLLSQWIRLPHDDLHIRHATNSWLSPAKVNVALGPGCDTSPHPTRELPLDLGTAPYIDMLFGPQKADQGHASKTAKHEESQTPGEVQTQNKVLPAPEEVLVTLRLQVDSCRPAELSALVKILLGGTPVSCRNRQLWIQAVQDYFDDVPLCVPCRKLLQLVWETAPQVGCNVYSALFPSLVVGCMFTSEPKMHWSVALHLMTRNWSTLIALGWVVMTWGVSKTTTSVFVLTSTVSPSMALL